MGILEDFQAQAQQAGAQAAQGAIQQAQQALPGLAQQAQQELQAQLPALQQAAMPAVQQAAHAAGHEAGVGVREGIGGISTETVLVGAAAVVGLGLLGVAAWKSGALREAGAANAVTEWPQPPKLKWHTDSAGQSSVLVEDTGEEHEPNCNVCTVGYDDAGCPVHGNSDFMTPETIRWFADSDWVRVHKVPREGLLALADVLEKDLASGNKQRADKVRHLVREGVLAR